MYSILYSSKANIDLTDEYLNRLCDRSLASNLRKGITGFIYSKNETIFQYLECSNRNVLYDLYTKIQNDPRHTIQAKVDFESFEGCLFCDWHMCLLNDDTIGKKSFAPIAKTALNTEAISNCDSFDKKTRIRQAIQAISKKYEDSPSILNAFLEA